MTNIPRTADNVEAKAANIREDNNECEIGNSDEKKAFSPDSIPSDAPETKNEIHSFSRSLAREIRAKKGKDAHHGAHEAMVLKYLANRSSTIRRPDGSFYTSLDELVKHFPCIGRTALWEIVIRLEKQGYIRIDRCRNPFRPDRTLWYSVSTKVRNRAEEDLLYFDSKFAGEVGILAAVLYRNFQYWTNQSMELLGHGDVEMSPAKLARLLPFGKRTIIRALEDLAQSHLKKVSCGKVPVYAAREITADATVPNPDMTMPNPDTMMPNPDVTVPNPDTYTSLVTFSNPLETPSKQKPPVSGFEIFDVRIQNGVINSFINTTSDTQNPDTRSSASVFSQKECNDSPAPNQHHELWELVTDAEFLHEYVKVQASWIGTMNEDGKARFISIIDKVCREFLKTLSNITVLEWRNTESLDTVFKQLAPVFREHLAKLTYSACLDEHPLICFGALECLLGALLYRQCVNRHTGFYTVGIECLQRVAYLLSTDVDEMAREAAKVENSEWLKERMNDLASKDRHKEDDAFLAPATKAKIFRNAVNARNEVGLIFWDGSHRQRQISMGKFGLRQVQRLFERNSELTPAAVLKVLDRGMTEFVSRPMPKKHESNHRHFLRLNDICHFVNALKILVPHYGCSADFDGVTFLGEDTLDTAEEGEYEDAAA